jgi:hypothetical protein
MNFQLILWIVWGILAILFIVSIWLRREHLWRDLRILLHGRAYVEKRERLGRWIDSL